jgi:hypothetical protein
MRGSPTQHGSYSVSDAGVRPARLLRDAESEQPDSAAIVHGPVPFDALTVASVGAMLVVYALETIWGFVALRRYIRRR